MRLRPEAAAERAVRASLPSILLAVTTLFAWPSDARAGAWARGRGEAYAKASVSYLKAEEMFDDSGDPQYNRLVSLPYPFGQQLEDISTSLGATRALWLLPITAAERAFARSHGVEALEHLFDEHAINPLAVQRGSVV